MNFYLNSSHVVQHLTVSLLAKKKTGKTEFFQEKVTTSHQRKICQNNEYLQEKKKGMSED
jgi:hypothetical protein